MSARSVFASYVVDVLSMKTKRMAILFLVTVASCIILKPLSFVCLIALFQSLFFNEENGVSATFFAPISKKCTVFGRYLFALSLLIVCVALNLLADWVAPILQLGYTQGNIFMYAVLSVAMLALFSIEMPFFYWLGYRNFRLINFPVLIGSMALIGRVVGLEQFNNILTGFSERAHLVLLLIAATLVLFLCSLFVSVKIYGGKDI